MAYSAFWGLLATVLSGVAIILYTRSMMKGGGSRPSRMTWFILAALSSISAWSYFHLGATYTFGAALMAAVGSITVAVLSLKYGHGGWQTIDKLTLAGVAITALIWWLTGSAFAALASALAIDFLALVPTIAKLWRWPKLEEATPWFVIVAGNICNVLALDVTRMAEWTIELAIYPLYMVLVNGFVLLMIVRPWGR